MNRSKAPALLCLALLGACSPLYVARSTSGHAGLLWRRRSISRTIADPKTSPALKKKLEAVAAMRSYAFDKLALKRSHDYEAWTPVKGSVLTWLVSASERLNLRSYEFRFPFAGAFPYKGHFRRDLAEAYLRYGLFFGDLDGEDDLKPNFIAEAIQYRNLDRNIWKN